MTDSDLEARVFIKEVPNVHAEVMDGMLGLGLGLGLGFGGWESDSGSGSGFGSEGSGSSEKTDWKKFIGEMGVTVGREFFLKKYFDK